MSEQSSPKKMRLLPAEPGTCAMCATAHDEREPHNRWSLFYQMRFKQKYGRDATDADAIAHLSAEYRTRAYPPGKVKNMQELVADFERLRGEYKSLLKEHGEEWTEPAGSDPIPEPYATSESSVE